MTVSATKIYNRDNLCLQVHNFSGRDAEIEGMLNKLVAIIVTRRERERERERVNEQNLVIEREI